MSGVQSLARPEIAGMSPYVSARSLTEASQARIYLDANESALENPCAPGLNRYPSGQPPELIARLSELYGVAAESLMVTRGSDEGIDLLVRAFCRAERDAILICPPTYGMYEVAAAIQGAAVIRLPLKLAPEPLLELPGLEAQLEREAPRVKILFLCSPNNPTGTAWSLDELSAIIDRVGGRAITVVDEAYSEFNDGLSMASRLSRHPELVVLRTLSKAWSLAGARCGSLIGRPETLSLLHQIRAPYPIPTPTVDAVLAATAPDARAACVQGVEDIRQERVRLASRLRALAGVDWVYGSAANFLLVRFRDSKSALAGARRAGIILRDRSSEVSGCIRITVGTPAQNDDLLRVLEEVAR